MSFSQRIKQNQAAEMIGLSSSELTKRLFEWSDIVSFTIVGDEIVVDNISEFTAQLDSQFADWEEKEASKIGKI